LVFTNCLSQAEMLCAHSYFHKNSVLTYILGPFLDAFDAVFNKQKK